MAQTRISPFPIRKSSGDDDV